LSSSIETLRSDLDKLIRKFQADQEYYLSGDYLEAQARVDFISPLFMALGWDVENEAGLAHHQREVIVERERAKPPGALTTVSASAGKPSFLWRPKRPPKP
jgi:hypothetical protein